MIILRHENADRNLISICTELDLGLPLVTADRVQRQQVLMNLLLNGVGAMKDANGELSVTSKKTDDGQLLVSVSDSGIGLPIGEGDRISRRSSPPKHRAPAWDCPSVGGLSSCPEALC